MIQFFVSAFLLGAIGGAAVSYSKFGPKEKLSPVQGWAAWLATVASLFAVAYTLSVPVYALLVQEYELYAGLGVAAIAYAAFFFLLHRRFRRRAHR